MSKLTPISCEEGRILFDNYLDSRFSPFVPMGNYRRGFKHSAAFFAIDVDGYYEELECWLEGNGYTLQMFDEVEE